jgi:hypothetical protein
VPVPESSKVAWKGVGNADVAAVDRMSYSPSAGSAVSGSRTESVNPEALVVIFEILALVAAGK